MLGRFYLGQAYPGQTESEVLDGVITVSVAIIDGEDIVSSQVYAGQLVTVGLSPTTKKKIKKKVEEAKAPLPAAVESNRNAVKPRRRELTPNLDPEFNPFTYKPPPDPEPGPPAEFPRPERIIEKVIEKVVEIRTIFPQRMVRKKVWIIRKKKPDTAMKRNDWDYNKLLQMIEFLEAV